jgi:hypothetical protein
LWSRSFLLFVLFKKNFFFWGIFIIITLFGILSWSLERIILLGLLIQYQHLISFCIDFFKIFYKLFHMTFNVFRFFPYFDIWLIYLLFDVVQQIKEVQQDSLEENILLGVDFMFCLIIQMLSFDFIFQIIYIMNRVLNIFNCQFPISKIFYFIL